MAPSSSTMYIFIILLALPALIFAEKGGPAEEELFKLINKNGDGIITTVEIGDFFKDMDTDKDTFISHAEWIAVVGGIPALEPYVELLFRAFDKNDEGRFDRDILLKAMALLGLEELSRAQLFE